MNEVNKETRTEGEDHPEHALSNEKAQKYSEGLVERTLSSESSSDSEPEPEIEFRPYTNADMYRDIQNMYNEVTKPQNDLTKKILKEAAEAWEESDRLGIPDEKADPCVDHFIAKYPLLAANAPYIFKVCLLKERHIDMNLVQNGLALGRGIEEGKISKHEAEVAFGKQLARRYFPQDVYKEVEHQMKDPQKVAQMRVEAEAAAKNAEKNGPKTVKVKGPKKR